MIILYASIKPKLRSKFIECVYQHFADLATKDNVKHTREYINEILNKGNLIVALNNVKKQGILGYIIGEYMILDYGRKAYYISYIYVIKPYRHKKIGSKLLDFAIQHSKYNNILLTFDTKNPVLMKFYTSKGFQPDWVHRSFDDIQVYCLIR